MGWGDDCRQDHDNYKSVLALIAQKFWRNQSYPREEKDQHRKLEDDPHAENEVAHRVVIIGNRNDILKLRRKLIVSEKIDRKRSDDKVGKHHPQKKQQRTPENNTPCILQLIRTKCRSDEFPKLEEYIGKGEDESQNEGYRKAHHELTAQLRVLKLKLHIAHAERVGAQKMAKITHPTIRNKFGMGWAKQNLVKYPLYLQKDKDCYQDDGSKRADNMPSQILNMICKAHLRARGYIAALQKSGYKAHRGQ